MAKNPKRNNKKKNKPTIPRWLWYSILVSAIAALVCAVFLIVRWCMNAYYVSEAEKGHYHPEIEERLTQLNFPDGYIVWYNLGNYYYQEGDYEESVDCYYRAIDCGIPYEKECEVKVNLALAMINELSEEEWDAFLDAETSAEMDAQARNVEKTLITARSILIEDGCAHEDDEDGHNEQAQILKDEIDELLNKDEEEDDEDEDEDQDENNDDQDDDSDDENGGGNNQSSREDEVMNHIQDQKEEAQEERAEDQQFFENYYGFGSEDEGEGGSEEGGGGSGADNGQIW